METIYGKGVCEAIAMGRLHFLGCNLSDFTSKISLKQYMELAASENATNAHKVFKSSFAEKSFSSKKSGKNINIFFTHCAGLAKEIIFFIVLYKCYEILSQFHKITYYR